MHKSKHDEDVKQKKKKYVTPEKYEKKCGIRVKKQGDDCQEDAQVVGFLVPGE